MSERSLEVAQHEAAHVVVGVALGLRLRKAVVGRTEDTDGELLDGYAWFTNHGAKLEYAVMYAAGVAWDQLTLSDYSSSDAKLAVGLVGSRNLASCVKIARLLLASRVDIHTRITKALLEKDLNSRDIAAIARGKRVE